MIEMRAFCLDPELTRLILEMSEDDLRAFAEVHSDMTSDKDIEIYIFSLCVLTTKSRSKDDGQLTIQLAERWLESIPNDESESARRRKILNNVSGIVSGIVHHELEDIMNHIVSTPIEVVIDEVMKYTSKFETFAQSFKRRLEVLPLESRPIMAVALAKIRLVQYIQDPTPLDSLSRLIDTAQKAFSLNGPNSVLRELALEVYSLAMFFRAQKSTNLDDISHAIEYLGNAVLTPWDKDARLNLTSNLSKAYKIRYEQSKESDDLDQALKYRRVAIKDISIGNASYLGYLKDILSLLIDRVELTGEMSNLDEAIKYTKVWLEIADDNLNEERLFWLGNLANMLSKRQWQSNDVGDINQAIEIAELVLAASLLEDGQYIQRLCRLSSLLRERSLLTGLPHDIDQAIALNEEAINKYAPSDPGQVLLVTELMNSLSARNDHTASINSINRAIDIGEKALQTMSMGDGTRADLQAVLAGALEQRFTQKQAIEDLDHSIELSRKATDFYGRPDHPASLDLANRLSYRYNRKKNIEDLDAAINTLSNSVNTVFKGQPLAVCLSNLGSFLFTRFQRLGKSDDLSRAIEVLNQAVGMDIPDHVRACSSRNLSQAYSILASQPGADFEDNINSAITTAERTLNIPNPYSHGQAGTFVILAQLYEERLKIQGEKNMKDYSSSLSLYLKGWECQDSNLFDRIHAGVGASILLMSDSQWKEASAICQKLVDLLTTASTLALRNQDKQYILGGFPGLATETAAIMLSEGEATGEAADVVAVRALRYLEKGRGVIAGLLLEVRTDISALRQQHPHLASEFIALRNQLDTPAPEATSLLTSYTGSIEDRRASRRHNLDADFANLCKEIRGQSGFQDFLLPPTAEELMNAAEFGPIVVVNCAVYRCDAFLVQLGRIWSIPLPMLTAKDATHWSKNLNHIHIHKILQWLWDAIASPVLSALGFNEPPSNGEWPRIWWVPTGPLTTLPIHAAGYHTLGSTNTVIDRVMSSYSTSIKSIIYGRRRSIPEAINGAKDEALLVAMKSTPGLGSSSDLPFAQIELEKVQSLCQELGLEPKTPLQRREDCLKYLRTCKVFHFAGHGKLDVLEPSNSSLLLNDWEDSPLTMGQIRDIQLQETAPILAYLSACSTGNTKHQNLYDECMHLVSGFQLAGFRHVVGTLWEVADSFCVKAARIFYTTLGEYGITDFAICLGLHQAVLALRGLPIQQQFKLRKAIMVDDEDDNKDQNVEMQGEDPMYWASYIHFGV